MHIRRALELKLRSRRKALYCTCLHTPRFTLVAGAGFGLLVRVARFAHLAATMASTTTEESSDGIAPPPEADLSQILHIMAQTQRMIMG